MKHYKEVLEIFKEREIKEYGFNDCVILNFWLIIDFITFKELRNKFVIESMIDIQPWNDEYIRVCLTNVYK